MLLTADNYFLIIHQITNTVIDSDYLVSDTSVSFTVGANNGAQSCISITAICDSQLEGNEVFVVGFRMTAEFMIDISGNGFFHQTDVEVLDAGEL